MCALAGRVLLQRKRGGAVKARVVRRAPLALAYGCVNEEKLREVFAAMGVQVRVLQPEDCGTRLGVLAGEAGPAGGAGVPAPQHSVLVFAYLPTPCWTKPLPRCARRSLALTTRLH